MTTDGELLRRYTETNSESAFAELVGRHLNLVYSAALRQVNGDAHLAQDVAQTVFADLARKAASLAGRPVLTGWLYTSAHFAAAKAVRTEQRRHTREEEAQLMNQLLCDPTPDLDWEKLRPVLDAAMLELSETDREAVLLRYFNNRPHAEIASRLGLSENAARMRVDRALEQLRMLLVRRGVSNTAALSAVISANAVQVAPAGLAITISTAAFAGTTLATAATTTVTKTIAITTLQKTLIAAALAAAVGTGIYEARQASTLRNQIQTLQQQESPLAEQVRQLQSERENTTRQLAALRDDNERLNRSSRELLKLRGDVARLRKDAEELARLKTAKREVANDAFVQASLLWKAKAARLKQLLAQMPNQKIPELILLDEEAYLDVAKDSDLETDEGIKEALSRLRFRAENLFAIKLRSALAAYTEANRGNAPSAASELAIYFDGPIDNGVFERYEVLNTGTNVVAGWQGGWIITQKNAVEPERDKRWAISPVGFSPADFKWPEQKTVNIPRQRLN